MRRVIAGLALATAATLATVAPAQAATADPVKTLKKQFKPGHGVRVSETVRSFRDGKAAGVTLTTGKLAFGKSGVVGADVSHRVKSPKGQRATPLPSLLGTRVISIGGHTYMQGGMFADELPEGKKWIRYEDVVAYQSNQTVDIFNPKVLKGLVAKAENVKGDYKGTITLKELARFQGVKLSGTMSKIKVKYLLDTNGKGLITRVVSDMTLDYGIMGSSRAITESRYTGWGAKVKITAPPKSQWIDSADLIAGLPDTEVPSEIPDNAISSLGVGG
ncbi:hypothetical protein [Nonomuraea sp. C10]|uniref:hypothetical protein n=1 Tax=Nonomuraea sp. C10 TaxID=2600577 RepID=UPI0011CDD229|nr:hypothetical protein [Nonomuraea sp. C10]TXK35925.1 hypothetical protein FR742_42965 [Nonomuraea sp. C10]